ncbi:trigger factor [Chloroflexota bacterium]
MKVTNEKTEERQVYLTIEMEPEELEKSLTASYKRLVNKANIPGFRKGKAPRDVAERYMGKESILEDALNQIVPDAYVKAVEEQEIKAIAQPQIEVVQTDPVIFKATVPLMPVIELGDYRSIRITPEVEEITEEKANSVLEEVRHQHATWEPVERPVEFGDLVGMDIESNIEGESFIEQKGAQYQVIEGFSGPVPGFPEQITGIAKNEEKEFKLTLPDDYPKNELAGKEANIKVKVTEIKEEKLPELNDELAVQVEPEIKTLDALKAEIVGRLKERAEEKARADFEDKVIQAVVGCSKIEYPPIMVEAEIDGLLNEQAQRLQWDEKALEEYLKRVNKTVEQLREEMRPLATKRVASSLALGKVAEDENIEVSDADIDNEIENMVKGTTEDEDKIRQLLSNLQYRNSIRQLLLTKKTVAKLEEIAKGEEKKEEK